ncbi:phosphatidylinositol-glycan-specific phospholipase D isoform X1 [Sphaerodactylus townsendi]|uniref:phosphatidylinositol-glycan-specific phospholipase D isoform X1 n=1 Tax=Sphaerodactylus townsendi TaxID=933632 RepID=UPI002026B2F1|nr:phosphatidylinositol-glycan-specific phospholipase D isoform X1 [Sphaerodactylus townsendi]XP_048364050.1 phosphatidylinositol-glycan-specific phospholipase D isoform X1 [Sphaerodactylus townsendi]
MEVVKIWTILLAVLCAFYQRASPCGLSTHLEIAHRALEFFNAQKGNVDYQKLLLTHQDAFQAGSIYPDAFYSGICKHGLFHQVSEDTHWAPFLNTSIHYIRKNYPQPWDEAAEKLVAFLFGITSHMVADVSWHSLGIEQGFLRAMAAIDFHGSYSEAHSAGDFGGDVLSQYELDFNYLDSNWYIPVKDLMSIYEEFYGQKKITEDAIIECTYLQFLELCGEILSVAKLYPIYAHKSPFLVDKFHEYFLGGVDDMAFSSNNIFELTSQMLTHGTSDCFIPENPLYIRCKHEPRNTIIKPKQLTTEHHKNISSLVAESAERNMHYTKRGVSFDMPPLITSYLQFQNGGCTKNCRKLFAEALFSKYINQPCASYFLTTPYARLGWAMTSADLNQDGYDDLVIGAPGYSKSGRIQIGRVYVVYSNNSGLPCADLNLDQEANEILEGTKLSGRFGSALAVLDFNEDGVMDLAVGAPSVGSQELTYKGSVYIFFGSVGRKGFYSLPNITIVCQEIYCNLGWSLLVADIDEDGNNDLLVGSPYAPGGGKQRGFVVGFYSFFNRSSQGVLSVLDADWMAKGDRDYAWFGSSLSSVQLQNMTLLLIGSPSWKSCTGLGCYFSQATKQAVGRVYGYILPHSRSWFTLTGDKDMGKLGSSLATGFMSVEGIPRHVLVIGAPTQDSTSHFAFITSTVHQGGTVLIYDLTDSTRPLLLSTFNGDRRFSRFGEDVHLRDLDGDGFDEIITASPLRTEGIVDGMFGRHSERVYIFSGNQTTSGNVTDHCKSWTSPCPEDWAKYVLISPERRSRFGSAVVTVKSGQKNAVVVAAERSSVKARLSGRLFIYPF